MSCFTCDTLPLFFKNSDHSRRTRAESITRLPSCQASSELPAPGREAARGNIVQASSESLHNYPDAEVKMREPDPEQEKTPQPRTGASAIAKEE